MSVEPLNYLRQARAALQQQWLPWARLRHPADAKACEEVLQAAQQAPKFVLPDGGRLLNDRLRGLPHQPRLPFSTVVLEYACNTGGQGIVEQVYDRTPVSCPRRIVVAWQDQGGSSIFVQSILFMDDLARSGVQAWTMTPYMAEIEPQQDSPVPVRAPTYAGQPVLASLAGSNPHTSHLCLRIHALGTMALMAGEKWHESAYLDMNDEITAVMELIEALSCSNVGHEALPVRPLNRSAARRGALPFDEYRVLTIRAEGAGSGQPPTGRGAHALHRSPREHLRRGHIRIYESGKRIWINPTLVNAGAGGKIRTVRDMRRAA